MSHFEIKTSCLGMEVEPDYMDIFLFVSSSLFSKVAEESSSYEQQHTVLVAGVSESMSEDGCCAPTT